MSLSSEQFISVVPPSNGMTAIQIPCCLCGTVIFPNAANQCGACLAQQFDLKSLLQRGPGGGELAIHQCRRCRRFRQSEKYWEDLEPESPELLKVCVKQIPALHGHVTGQGKSTNNSTVQRLTLTDAMWVWTEPHSMRLKLRLTIRAEINESPRTVVIQQRVLVELIVRWTQCFDCNREFTSRTWHAVVQLRQKRSDGSPRKGLILLEMALAKNAQVRKHVISMETTRHGFDFYFHSLPHAQAFAAYLARVAPIRIKTTTKMVSEDFKNNTKHMKFTVTCDMVPLCRDDLILCDKRGGDGASAGRLSGRLCLVSKMSNSVHLVDASPVRNSSQMADAFCAIHPEKYWKGEKNFQIISHSKRLVRFVVLDVELCDNDSHRTNPHAHGDEAATLYVGPESGIDKYALADVEVAREADFGQNDETFHVVTHLGNLLQVGDVVLGYDLVASVLPSEAEWALEHNAMNSSFVMPDIVLVKKVNKNHNNLGHDDDGAETLKKPRSKSSVSKKREKRRLKDEKKQKDREAAAARMGFIPNDTNNDMEQDNDDLFDQDEFQEEKAQFERELENDPDLALELNRAEQELMAQQETTEQQQEDDNPEEESTHDNDDDETNNNVDAELTLEETKEEVEEGGDIHRLTK